MTYFIVTEIKLHNYHPFEFRLHFLQKLRYGLEQDHTIHAFYPGFGT